MGSREDEKEQGVLQSFSLGLSSPYMNKELGLVLEAFLTAVVWLSRC